VHWACPGISSQNGGAEYWATDELKMTEEQREELEKKGWVIHCCGVERAQVRNSACEPFCGWRCIGCRQG